MTEVRIDIVNFSRYALEFRIERVDFGDYDRDPTRVFTNPTRVEKWSAVTGKGRNGDPDTVLLARWRSSGSFDYSIKVVEGPCTGAIVKLKLDPFEAPGSDVVQQTLQMEGSSGGRAGLLTYQEFWKNTNPPRCVLMYLDDWTDLGNMSNWMSFLSDQMPLFQMTIPGTHDTATYDVSSKGPSANARCQEDDIPTQLRNGIRALDLRFAWSTYHGRVDSVHTISLNYFPERIFKEIYDFLQAHPKEFIIAQVGTESDSTTQTIERIIQAGGSTWVYSSETWPDTLGQVRGKMLVIKSGSMATGTAFKGIVNANWPDNFKDSTATMGGKLIRQQCFYGTSDLQEKWSAIEYMLAESSKPRPASGDWPDWFIHSTSASGKFDPDTFAMLEDTKTLMGAGRFANMPYGMNRITIDYLGGRMAPLGLIWMDFYAHPGGIAGKEPAILPKLLVLANVYRHPEMVKAPGS